MSTTGGFSDLKSLGATRRCRGREVFPSAKWRTVTSRLLGAPWVSRHPPTPAPMAGCRLTRAPPHPSLLPSLLGSPARAAVHSWRRRPACSGHRGTVSEPTGFSGGLPSSCSSCTGSSPTPLKNYSSLPHWPQRLLWPPSPLAVALPSTSRDRPLRGFAPPIVSYVALPMAIFRLFIEP